MLRSGEPRRHRLIGAAVAVSVVAAFAAVGVLAPQPREPVARADDRPNVVVIEVDDMRTDELALLKKTTELLGGAVFDRAEVATSLCCPSRASFLSGQYSWNNQVQNNNDGWRLDRTNTLNTWLQDAGYSTAFIGKYLNGYSCSDQRPPGWDDWQGLCSNIYGMYKYAIQDNDTRVTYASAEADYQTDVLADRAAATVAEQAATGKPFFTWITPTAPHGGPGNRFAARYASSLTSWTPPQSPSIGEANVADKPAWVQRLKTIPGTQRKALIRSEQRRARMLLAVDDLVERTVTALIDAGQLDRTVIVFTSDNGFLRGEHRIRTGKEVAYRESLQVPLIISGPGIVARHVPDLVGNIDLAPTIAELAGVTPGRTVDGRSIVPLLQGTDLPRPRVLLHHVVGDPTADGQTGAHPAGDAVTSQRFKYVRLATGETELYDAVLDPYELVNVSGTPAYESVEAAMSTILADGIDCAGATCDIGVPNFEPHAIGAVECTVYFDCTFDATRSNDVDGDVVSYAWDFGDGSTSTAMVAAHTYEESGTYPVKLTVTDDAGATSTTEFVAAGVANLQPVPVAAALCSDLGCDFTGIDSYDPDGYIVAYRWQFGDGRATTMTSPSHAYLRSGTYLATLYVTDNHNATVRTTVSVTVTVPNAPPVAGATVSCTDSVCTFDGSTSTDADGSVVGWYWDFGDGETSDAMSPEHAYAVPGVFAVSLVVTDDVGDTSTIPAMLEVTIPEPPPPPEP